MTLPLTHNQGRMGANLKDTALEFFSKGGSIQNAKYYTDDYSSVNEWFSVFREDQELAFKLLFWSRDPRGGAGNRGLFRKIISSGAVKHPEFTRWMDANLDRIPEYGRFDDVRSLYGTPLEQSALDFLAENVGHALCAKWMDRKDVRLRDVLNLTSKEYRKLLVKNSNTVEALMCSKSWNDIDFGAVPSIASVRYINSFMRNDKDRYLMHIEKNGIPAATAFPHEARRLLGAKVDDSIIEAFWTSLPNYIKSDERILPMIDVSGSMTCEASGSISCMDVAVSLGMYCSDQLEGEMHRRYLTFDSVPRLKSWHDKTVAEALRDIDHDDWGMSTNIALGLDSILEHAQMFNVAKDQMPTALMILSDMQFDECTSVRHSELTVVEDSLRKWVDAGFDKPAVIYWNINGYAGQPVTDLNNLALISGFSPAIMQHVLENLEAAKADPEKALDPWEVMQSAIAKYQISTP
tara:strand:+ start:11127 stop:12518 length:1392 start_codon:yes stop_codon:yes gene_type:complete